MANEEGKPNAWLWATLFAVGGALIAGAVHAVLGYYTVTGASFDWLEWKKHATIEPGIAATELFISVFLLTLVLSATAGAISWSLAKRDKLRGDPDKGDEGSTTSWSEFSFYRSLGLSVMGAIFAALTGFLAAELLEGSALTGQEFFVLKVAVGTLVAIVAVVQVTRAVAHTYATGRLAQENPEGNIISRIQLWSAENAVSVVVVVLLISGATGFGITKITTDVDVADVLPRGNGNTTAAKNLSAEFQSTFTQQVTLQLQKAPEQCQRDSDRVLPNRVTDVNCQNITDEVYVRSMEELFQLIQEEEDHPIEFNIAVNGFYKLINWTAAGGQEAEASAFSLPDRSPQGEQRYAQVDRLVWQAIPDVVTPTIDPSFDQAASLYLVSSTTDASSQEIGRSMLEFRDDYVQMVEDEETDFRVWGDENPPLFTVDIPVANHHQSQLAKEDFATLFPLIFGFIVVSLYFSFRNFTAIGIAGSTLLASTLWTYGTMGYMGIPLNTLNLTVLPLILGTGIDFAIHQVTEFAHHKREGLSDEEALRTSGAYAGFAMFIAAVTSISGLLVMTISPSLLMAQLGLLAAIAIASVYTLTITLMPALLKLARSSDAMGQKFEPSGLITGLAKALSRRRIVAAGLVVLLTAGSFVGMANLTIEEFGEPAKNFPEDDPLRIEHEDGIRGFYDLEEGGTELKTNIVVFQGDNTDIQSHQYIEAVQNEMAAKENLDLSTSRTLPFLIRTWMTVKGGGPGAIEQLSRDTARTCVPPAGPTLPCQGFSEADNYPQTRAEIQSELDQMFNSPLDTFASLFVDEPQYNISTMTLATTTGDFEDAEDAWDDVWASVNALETQKPHDLEPAFVGNTALNYLFITEELPWLSYLGIVSGIVLAFLAAVFTKSWRATIAVTLVMGLTGIWWLGVLPAFDIGLAITLMLPAVFITSIGSDYAIHMSWNLLKNPNREEVYGVVGKAILFSAITDIGAFAIFTQTQNVAAAKAMVATVLAIGVMFVVTMLIMPIFYPYDPSEADEPEATEPTIDHAPTTRVVESGA